MIIGVIHFTKCSERTTMASARIARYIAEQLEATLIDDLLSAKVHTGIAFETLFIVNSPYAFCQFRDEVQAIAAKAKRLIWVQNDYAIAIPSQLRALKFRYTLSSVEQQGALYINWNQLTYYPSMQIPKGHTLEGLFYYGAYREGRIKYFKEYFGNGSYAVSISSTAVDSFKQLLQKRANVKYFKPFEHPEQIGLFKYSLYIEDAKSHSEYHSPANRFYECYSAGTALLIDAQCLHTFEKAGIELDASFIVHAHRDVIEILRNDRFKEIAALQRSLWGTAFSSELDKRFKALMSRELKIC